MPLVTGQILNSRYRIVKLLGQGGFGAVYQAWDLNLRGPCAVKENYDASTAAQAQFAREASLLFNLRHPNLPRVFDSFSVLGQGQYLVMDYIEGEDLSTMLERANGPLREEIVLPWIIQVCDALAYLHTQNPPVIHRDIKPANIRITSKGQAILVDFGIAKVYDPQLKTTTGARAVTPGFSPPEQYGQGTTDAQSDIYALGATLYTVLTGQEPPASVDIVSGCVAPPQAAHARNTAVSLQVSAAIERAMQLNRSTRYRTAAEFKTALEKFDKRIRPSQDVISRPVKAASAKAASVYQAPLTFKQKSNRKTLMVVIIVLVILCCCMFSILNWIWNNGDQVLGVSFLLGYMSA
jgi:serine/threonine protein kinase